MCVAFWYYDYSVCWFIDNNNEYFIQYNENVYAFHVLNEIYSMFLGSLDNFYLHTESSIVWYIMYVAIKFFFERIKQRSFFAMFGSIFWNELNGKDIVSVLAYAEDWFYHNHFIDFTKSIKTT